MYHLSVHYVNTQLRIRNTFYLLCCEKLDHIRVRHLQKIQNYMDNIEKGAYKTIVDNGKLVCLILDCTRDLKNCSECFKQLNHRDIEALSHKMCYDLHLARTRLLGDSADMAK